MPWEEDKDYHNTATTSPIGLTAEMIGASDDIDEIILQLEKLNQLNKETRERNQKTHKLITIALIVQAIALAIQIVVLVMKVTTMLQR